jgi:hypothetical protein
MTATKGKTFYVVRRFELGHGDYDRLYLDGNGCWVHNDLRAQPYSTRVAAQRTASNINNAFVVCES